MWQEDGIIKIKIPVTGRSIVWGGGWASQLLVRVQTRAARREAWAGSESTGVFVEPCDLAVACPAHSATQTSACLRASNAGRRTCCSRSPQCVPWTCSSGCTSPVITRGRQRGYNSWLLLLLCYTGIPDSNFLLIILLICLLKNTN